MKLKHASILKDIKFFSVTGFGMFLLDVIRIDTTLNNALQLQVKLRTKKNSKGEQLTQQIDRFIMS